MPVIAPRDISRYSRSVRGGLSFFFFAGCYPEDRDLACIIPKMGTRNGERRRYETTLSHDPHTAEFSARGIKAKDCEMVRRKKSLPGSLGLESR